MPSYKLIYFSSQMKGRAEPIRFLFSYAGVDFIDEGIDDKDWLKVKPTMPFSQVPVLEVDGKRINQSIAICRYLAKQFGLTGKDEWEDLEIDATVDSFLDYRAKVGNYCYEKHPEVRARKLKEIKELRPVYIGKLDEQVKKNGGYLVGGRLTWADIIFASYIELMNFRTGMDILEDAENLKALKDKVFKEPGIKSWLEKHPINYR